MKFVGSSFVSAITQTPASGPFVLFTTPLIMPSGSARGAAFATPSDERRAREHCGSGARVAREMRNATIGMSRGDEVERCLLFMRILRSSMCSCRGVGRVRLRRP